MIAKTPPNYAKVRIFCASSSSIYQLAKRAHRQTHAAHTSTRSCGTPGQGRTCKNCMEQSCQAKLLRGSRKSSSPVVADNLLILNLILATVCKRCTMDFFTLSGKWPWRGHQSTMAQRVMTVSSQVVADNLLILSLIIASRTCPPCAAAADKAAA